MPDKPTDIRFKLPGSKGDLIRRNATQEGIPISAYFLKASEFYETYKYLVPMFFGLMLENRKKDGTD